jgi:excisionase family DNA binding protein
MHDEHNPLLMDIPAVAKLLSISKGLAYQMARDGRLPTVRLAKRAVRVPRHRLHEWIEQRTREDAAPNGGVQG